MSSLTTGQGTPWGASRYGDPSLPGAPKYQSDPNAYQSFDRSELSNRAIANSNANNALQMAQSKARLSATGAGRSSAANVHSMDLAGQAENNAANILQQGALAGWQDKLNQMNQQNAWNLNNYGQQLDAYKTQAGLAAAERENRRNALSTAFGPLGGLANLFSNY